MSEDDSVDTESLIFTEEEVFMIAGWLASEWDIKISRVTRDTERAVQAVLSRTRDE